MTGESNVTKYGIKTLAIQDVEDNVIQQMQINSYGDIKNCGRLGQYGLYGNAPKNSFVVVMQINGQEENLFGIEDDVNNRPRGLKEGEVMIFNTLTKNYIYLKEDSNTEFYAKKDMNIKAVGTVNVTAETVILNSPTQIKGGLTVDSITAESISTQTMEVGNGARGTFKNSVNSEKGIVTDGN